MVQPLVMTLPVKDVMSEKAEGGTRHSFSVDISSLGNYPQLTDWAPGVNPRELSTRGNAVYREIIQTLRDRPQEFYLGNRGITLAVESFVYDRVTKTAKVSLTSAGNLHGVVDGNHTLCAIQAALLEYQDENRELEGRVGITVWQGLSRKQLVGLAHRLNNQKKVKNISKMDLDGSFELLKKVFEPFNDRIAYHEGDVNIGKASVEDILQTAIIFHPDHWGSLGHGCRSSLSLVQWSNWAERPTKEFKQLVKMLPDLMRLRDKLTLQIPELWGPMSYSRISMFKSKKEPRIRFLSTEEETSAPYPVYKNLMNLVLSGYRVNLRKTRAGDLTLHMPWDEFLDMFLPWTVSYLKSNFMKIERSKTADFLRSSTDIENFYLRLQKEVSTARKATKVKKPRLAVA